MAQFDYFVVFAEMRTGSNFLEANLNRFDGLTCHGEAFNPVFIGYPDNAQVLNVTQRQREQNPQLLIDRIRQADGMNGFRFFHDHDPRVLDTLLNDPRCAKIILTRNPVDSYISWQIASKTGQWKLTNATHATSRQIDFKPREFENHMQDLQHFQVRLLNTLQRSGQTAFYVAYEDLQDVEVMNGLAKYLGVKSELKALDKSFKRQNPMPTEDKVSDFPAMESSLARLDRFNLNRTPNFEPRRGPMIPRFFAAPKSALLYMPIRTGPDQAVCDWMGRLDEMTGDDVIGGFTQKTMRTWMAQHPGHRRFSVLRHPVARAHAAFCHHILQTGEGCYHEIRQTLRVIHNLVLPDEGAEPETDSTYTMDAHRAAFLLFLGFIKQNLNGQTSIRMDAAWGSQMSVLQGLSQFAMPDMILREDRLRGDFAMLAGQLGHTSMPEPDPDTDPYADRLAAIYDAEVEKAARDACALDYLAFGFGNWRGRQ